MIRKSQGFRAIIAVAAVAASMLVTQVAFSSAAQARCAGDGVEVTSLLRVNLNTYVTERPIVGTCNSNNTYRAEIQSNRAGWRPSAWYQNNGAWTGHYGVTGGAWTELQYADNNSNSLIVLCADKDGVYWCGYLDQVAQSIGGPSFVAGFNRSNEGF
jgi:hypothetical protein